VSISLNQLDKIDPVAVRLFIYLFFIEILHEISVSRNMALLSRLLNPSLKGDI